MELLTERLRLRPMRLSDAPWVHEMSTAPGVALPAGYPTPKDLKATRARVARAVAGWRRRPRTRLSFAIVRRQDGVPAGLIHLGWPHPGVGELGYSVHPRFWGRGYASEAAARLVGWAFEEGGAHRVQATCWVRNGRSAGVLRNAGLRREGVLRGFLKRGRVVRDEYIFGLARRDR